MRKSIQNGGRILHNGRHNGKLDKPTKEFEKSNEWSAYKEEKSGNL